VLGRNIRHVDFSYKLFFLNNVNLNVNVFNASRKLRIVNQVNVALIVRITKVWDSIVDVQDKVESDASKQLLSLAQN
jgi:hypothetical protein